MRTFFISDLHLEDKEPAITAGFIEFLKYSINSSDRLFILGDFFNLWIGDDDITVFTQAIITELKAKQSTGTEIFFMHGNRDFLIGADFALASGCQLIQEPYLVKLGDKKTVLMHGDVLCEADIDYQQFRQMVRTPHWQTEFLTKPLDERKAIGQGLREKSKSMSANKAEDIMDVCQAAVGQVFAEHECDLLIHGHTHRPCRHQLKINNSAAERIVLGAWHDEGWVLVHDDIELTLKHLPY